MLDTSIFFLWPKELIPGGSSGPADTLESARVSGRARGPRSRKSGSIVPETQNLAKPDLGRVIADARATAVALKHSSTATNEPEVKRRRQTARFDHAPRASRRHRNHGRELKPTLPRVLSRANASVVDEE